jgi:2-polyprenyl-3-methyl-5-hydroxy-6-metoxy-1,4-benzoquinol methylase
MAELGYTVSGIDLAPAMIDRAQAKAGAAGCDIFSSTELWGTQVTDERYLVLARL